MPGLPVQIPADHQVLMHRLIVNREEELFIAQLELEEIEADTSLSIAEKRDQKEHAEKKITGTMDRLNALKKKRRELGE